MKTAFLVLESGAHINRHGTTEVRYADFVAAFAQDVIRVLEKSKRKPAPLYMTIATGTEVLHYEGAREIYEVLRIKLGVVEHTRGGEMIWVSLGAGKGRLEFDDYRLACDAALIENANADAGSRYEVLPLAYPETPFGADRGQKRRAARIR